MLKCKSYTVLSSFLFVPKYYPVFQPSSGFSNLSSLLVSSVFWFVSQPFLSYFSASCFTPPFPCISADLNLRQIYNVQLKIVLILDILWFLFLIFKRLELNALHFSLQWGEKKPSLNWLLSVLFFKESSLLKISSTTDFSSKLLQKVQYSPLFEVDTFQNP